MKYNPKAKLKVNQIKDRRTSGSVRRRAATGTPDSTDNVGITPEQAEADYLSNRYGQIIRKQRQQVGHVRYTTPKMVRHGKTAYLDNVPVRPDGADRAQPYKTKYRPDGWRPAKPKKIVVKRRNPDAEMRKIPQQKTIPIPRKTQSK